MERLTLKLKKPTKSEFKYLGVTGVNAQQVLNKLGEYEDLEEQQRLIKLPYPVGTELYFAFKLQGVQKDSIRRWQYNKKGLMFCSRGNAYLFDAIGKTVFLTKEEAEEKLKELQDK